MRALAAVLVLALLGARPAFATDWNPNQLEIPAGSDVLRFKTNPATGDISLAVNQCAFAASGLVCEGASADAFEGRLLLPDVTADRTWTVPNATGEVVLDGATQTLTGKTIDDASNTLVLDGGSLIADSVPVSKLETTGTASGSTYLAGNGAWQTPPGGTDTTCLDLGVVCLFAGSATEGGPATTALALNGSTTDCTADKFARGIAANGDAACSSALAANESWVGATATPTDIATQSELTSGLSGKQATLTGLGAGEGWVGPSATPTDLATQAELTSGLGTKQATLATLAAGEGWVGATATPTDIATQSELTTGLGTKEGTLPTLTANQSWVGASKTPTTVCQAGKAGCDSSGWTFTTSSVNGVTLKTDQTAAKFLDGTGAYTTPPSSGGAVATDVIWDAAGDLAVGTGADTAARLARGTVGQKLAATATTAAWKDEPWGDLVVEYEAECDGTSDDEPELEAAYDALTTSGGTIYVPDGKTCAIDGTVEIESNVMVRCGQGAGFKIVGGTWATAQSGAGAANSGMFTYDINRSNFGFDGCIFNLNDEATASIAWIGTSITGTPERITFANNVVTGSEDAAAANSALVAINCANFGASLGWCANVSNNQINCADGATTDAIDTGDVGIIVQAGGSAGGGAITNNSVLGCDEIGIWNSLNSGDVLGNTVVTGEGAGSIGIDNVGSDAQVGNNFVHATGTTSIGIKARGGRQSFTNNAVNLTGTSGIAYQTVTGATDSIFVANAHNMAAADAIGYDIDTPVVISAATGNRSSTNGDVHIYLHDGANQTQISGSKFTGGDWCIRPARTETPALNVRVASTMCISQDFGAIMLSTGWHIVGNTLNYTQEAGTSDAVLWLGDDGTSDGSNQSYCTAHSVIVGNNFHSDVAGGIDAFIWAPRSTTTGSAICKDIVIGDNLFLGAVETSDAAIDLAEGCTTNCPDFSDIEISGNNASFNTSGQTLVGFATGSDGTYQRINVGPNSCAEGTCTRGYTLAKGHLRDEPRETCMALDQADGGDLRAFWIAPAVGAKIVAVSCVFGDLDAVGTCTTPATAIEFEDEEGNVVTGSAVTCTATTAGAWTAATGTIDGGELLVLDVTAGDPDCDILACAQYLF